ncbi:DUF1168-domain-containing protein [Aaosphaeria arxii CBS 175.79]|uniref:DUF1168-domain-containing protein n=1 Tax=Aaosphaeria arxii CBS 175.79 TaxID=1450172 RepID=A0A6A5X7M2_9PLEO|nr:DUF1168-domain-containing protein [Aaosphaeria arxii CBS 175.79]KAF2008896.1 DUF1168-domain-containing protein [Aaosphaeria arxii CBS 175.79]
MSENIPESIPTSADPRSKRPVKRRALTPRAGYAADVEALFAKPDRDIHIPSSGPKKGVAPPPEIVANVQGSSAGAGSGEFHVYKASRRREYERLRAMDEEVKKEENEKDFNMKKDEQDRKDREKTEKNRAKREKAKARKAKQKKGSANGSANDNDADLPTQGNKIKKLAPNSALKKRHQEEEEETQSGGEVKNAAEIGLVIEDDD